MIPSTVDRVPQHTSDQVNQQIRRETEKSVARYATGGRQAITRRLEELDQEWDVERTLEANASTVSLIGLALGAALDRRWYLLPTAVAGFLLLHAVEGWCPPLPALRRLGFRTRSEIDHERYALKSLRGDFQNLSPRRAGNQSESAERALAAMRS